MSFPPLVRITLLALVPLHAHADACSIEDVTIEDFTPSVGSFSDGSSQFATIDGTLNSFCTATANVTLSITSQTRSGGGAGKTILVKNVPPGGMSFQALNVPFTADTTGYQVTVSDVAASNFDAGSVRNYGNRATQNNASSQVTNSAVNQAGNYAGWVASGAPWYYRR